MTVPLDWLETVGTATLGTLWWPLVVWTAAALAAMGLLYLWRSAHTLVHYTTRTALLLALPLGLLLAAVTDLSFLRLFTDPAVETPRESIFFLPLGDVDPAPSTPAGPAWSFYHVLGVVTILAGVLAAGRLSYLARHTLSLSRFRTRLPRCTDAPLQQVVDRQAARLGIRRQVRAVVTTQDVVPMTLGWRHPVIVVPAPLMEDDEHLHMTVLHELIHIRRQDILFLGIEYVIGALFLINPAVWLLRRSIGQYRELSCDAEVVTQPRINSKRYAALLYRFAAPPSFHRPLVLSMSASDNELKKRILAMKAHARPTHRWFSPKWLGLLLAALLLTSATVFVACSDLAGPDVEAANEASGDAAAKADVFVVVEEMPELIGGLQAVQEQLRYPRIAKEAGIEGRVIVQFVVDEAGRVVDPKVVKGLGGGLDEEALRVIGETRFVPGKQAGQTVPVKMSIPITFKLNPSNTASDNVRILNETFTLTHPEMSTEQAYAFTKSLYSELGVYRTEIKALEERLQNNPAPSEKATIEEALYAVRQRVREHIEARYEERQEESTAGPATSIENPSQTSRGNVEMAMRIAASDSDVKVLVEEMPALVGSLTALQSQLKYPTIARRAGIQGRVILEFIVDEEGRVVDPKVLRGLGAGCDEEALRVLQQARFEPGRENGLPVKVKMSMPITFKLSDP